MFLDLLMMSLKVVLMGNIADHLRLCMTTKKICTALEGSDEARQPMCGILDCNRVIIRGMNLLYFCGNIDTV